MKILITCVIDLGRLYIMLSVSLIFTNHLIDRYQRNVSVTMPFAIRVHGLVFTSASRIHLYTSTCDLSQDDDSFYPVEQVHVTEIQVSASISKSSEELSDLIAIMDFKVYRCFSYGNNCRTPPQKYQLTGTFGVRRVVWTRIPYYNKMLNHL